ncbi:MAG: ATP-binding protein [Candidatus Sumerlaeia bacterium]|nr:ATP-binding protein [Candidatus Sumerlaeia bacterium]
MLQIPGEQIQKSLQVENPWWDTGVVPPQQGGGSTPRPYLDLFLPLVLDRSTRRAVVLLGPRRVGKTWMINHSIERLIAQGADPKRLHYVLMEQPLYNRQSLESMLEHCHRASGTNPLTDECHVFFDEVQYVSEWEKQVKILVDRGLPCKIIVSGSAAAALRLKSVESGAGRMTDFMLPPLTFHEYLHLLEKRALIQIEERENTVVYTVPDVGELNRQFVEYINFGGYPEVLFSEAIRRDPARFIKKDIVDKVLLRDLPSLYGISDIQELNYLFTTLAYNTGQEISLQELSRNSGVVANTIRRYLEYLEAAFLIRIVHRVDRSARRFRRANFFKVYLTNPSMRAALFAPVGADDHAMGPLVETAVFSQLFHSDIRHYYARWEGGEVDLIMLSDDQRVQSASEIKWSDRAIDQTSDLRSLLSFAETHRLPQVLVTTRTRSAEKRIGERSVGFVHAAAYCFVLGRHFVEAKRLRVTSKGP